VYCPDLTSVVVASAAAVMALVRKGNRNRTVRQTEMNEHSSRSHTILQLRVEQRTAGGGGGGADVGAEGEHGALVTAKLNLVDLAGSERWRDPDAMEGERLSEMTSINTSLSALASVIAALTDKRRTHVPYRDSKLTHLLADSLGGNCRTTVIATVSPAATAFEETCSTLKFADRTRSVTTYASANLKADDTMTVDRLQKEVKRLRSMLVDYANAAGEGGEGEGVEGGAGGSVVGGLLATMEVKLHASEGESQRLRDRVRSLEEALKAEREQRRHLSRGWEEEKRGMVLQYREVAAAAAAEARGAAAVATTAGPGVGVGIDVSGVASSPTRGGARTSGGVGAVAAARAARADAAAVTGGSFGAGDEGRNGSGGSGGGDYGGGGDVDHSSMQDRDRFGSAVSYMRKTPRGGRPGDSPYASGNQLMARDRTAAAAKAAARVTSSADGGARRYGFPTGSAGGPGDSAGGSAGGGGGHGQLATSFSIDALRAAGSGGGEAPDEAWGSSDAGEGDPPSKRGGGWGRSSIEGANWQRSAQRTPEPPEPSTSGASGPHRANSPKKQLAKKPKKPKPVADDLGSWMYILGATRSSMQACDLDPEP
jgi:kinesin family protein 3/17